MPYPLLVHWINEAHARQWRRGNFPAHMISGDRTTLCACQADGGAHAWSPGPLAQLEELYFRPDLRDQSIGTDLLLDAIKRAQAQGCEEMHINVGEIDADTRHFYERHGFTNMQPGEDYRMVFSVREF